MIKEREYLLIILVLVFNISISYIYILIRARDGFLGFGTVLGCFEAGTNGTVVPVSRFGTVPGLFEVPDSPTASFVAFGGRGFFPGWFSLLEWSSSAAGFDFPGQMW